MRGVQRAAELVVKLIARTAEGEALQSAVVAVIAFTLLVGEVTGVDFQTVDLFRGQQGAGVAFKQQAGAVGCNDWQFRTLVPVAQHGIGDAHFGRRAKLCQIGFCPAVVFLLKEVDAARAALAAATVQTHAILRDTVHAEAHQPFGIAGCKRGDDPLTPFGFVLLALMVVAADIRIA